MVSDKTYSILVVDDEPLARKRLEKLLERHNDTRLACSVSTGIEAVEHIEDRKPDIVLLDIQMPGLSGLDVVRQIDPTRMPIVIFVTAYEEHALEAFELSSLDYLLKPYDDERFHSALLRAKRMVDLQGLEQLRDHLELLVRKAPVPAVDPQERHAYLERVAVEMRGQIKVVPVETIDYISADGPYARLHVGQTTYLIREQMQDLEDQLDPNYFFRIHRSTIVRVDGVDALFVNSGSKYALRLDGGTKLRVSRSRWDELSARLGVQPLKRVVRET